MHTGFYEIIVYIVRVDDRGWRSSTGLPTFYLHSNLQGTTSIQDAEHIARNMIQTAIGTDDSTLESINVTATPLEEGM